MPFDVWTERITSAGSEHDRRRLLAEIGAWQVGRLTDIPAQREASAARSRLYALIGDHDAAVREARSLLSLCQTPPLATPEELDAARRHVSSLGEKAIVGGQAAGAARRLTATEAPRKKGRAERQERSDEPRSLAAAAAAVGRGAWDEAIGLVGGQGGSRALLIRAAAVLSRAAASGDTSGLSALAEELRAHVGPRAPAEAPRAQALEHPLEVLVGQPVPKAWKVRLRIIEQWLGAHPKRVDDLAALALQHHVDVSGLREPAPWLITTTALALARDGRKTRDVLARLTEQDAWAVTAYAEWPLQHLVGVLRAANPARVGPVAIRRGVLSRGEPRDRKLWTLRLGSAEAERLVVVGAPSEEPYEDGLAERLADRIRELHPLAVLLAPGEGNAGLRAAAAERGIVVVDTTDGRAILDALPAPTAAPAAPARAPAEPVDDPLPLLRELLAADTLDVAAVTAAVARLRRAQAALGVARSVLAPMEPAVRAERAAILLRALHETVPPGVALQEAVTWAIELAAEGVSGAPLQLLLDAPDRLGGPGVKALTELVGTLRQAGWTMSRVFRGPTARERRDGPVLAALGAHTPGLWRIRVDRDGHSVETWFLQDPSPEARAAAPQLLLAERGRVVVLGDPALHDWYATLGGPSAVPWTPGAPTEPVLDALAAAATPSGASADS